MMSIITQETLKDALIIGVNAKCDLKSIQSKVQELGNYNRQVQELKTLVKQANPALSDESKDGAGKILTEADAVPEGWKEEVLGRKEIG